MGTTSQSGLRFTTACEGRSLQAYLDRKKGVWTIGVGHTKDVKAGDFITNEQMNDFLKADIAGAEGLVNAAIKNQVLPHQFDMLVDITFNAGAKFVNDAEVQAAIIGKADKTVAALFLYWVSDDGVILDGLLQRAAMRGRIYMQGYTTRNLAWIAKHKV